MIYDSDVFAIKKKVNYSSVVVFWKLYFPDLSKREHG